MIDDELDELDHAEMNYYGGICFVFPLYWKCNYRKKDYELLLAEMLKINSRRVHVCWIGIQYTGCLRPYLVYQW